MKISSLLKNLFVALALVGGLGIGAAQATTYNFNFSTVNGITGVGSFVSDGSTTISSGSGTLTGTSSSSGGFVGTYSMSSFFFVTSPTSNPSGPWAFDFTANGTVYSADYARARIGGLSYDGKLDYSPATGTSIQSGFTSASSPTAAGAPEIDGSLAPKVGFLLGCLFLMFGRKKQNTEPMMMA